MNLDLTDPPRAVLDILTRAANETKSPWRWPVLATQGGAHPGVRMLVVRAFHRAALAAGGRDHGAPALRPTHHPDYFAAFVYDPDGYNIEAVTHVPHDEGTPVIGT